MPHLSNIEPAPWNQAAVEAANQETGLNMTYRNTPVSYEEMDRVDAAEAYDNGYNAKNNMGSIWAPWDMNGDTSAWWNAFDRHREKLKAEAERAEA